MPSRSTAATWTARRWCCATAMAPAPAGTSPPGRSRPPWPVSWAGRAPRPASDRSRRWRPASRRSGGPAPVAPGCSCSTTATGRSPRRHNHAGAVRRRGPGPGRIMKSTKTITKLADGRELIYYDERPGMDRSAADTRDLRATRTHSEIRYDALLDQWVIIASHRQGRTHLPSTDRCPLCPSRPGRATEIPADDYDVAVFENRFPSLVPGGPVVGGDDALFVRRPGVGRCEVVCFTADHAASFAQLSPERVEVVLEAWTDRTRELGALPGVEHVFVFENRGEEIGITLTHPHGQIYAYPFVPPRMLRMLRSAGRRAGGRGPRGRRDRTMDGVRAPRRPLAVRGPRLPAPAPARPAGPGRRGTL